jgi:uncharacterized protein YjiS (DUF1127 family)
MFGIETPSPRRKTMRFPAKIVQAWHDYARRSRERRTIAAISELPPHLLKDIGWPGAHDRTHSIDY